MGDGENTVAAALERLIRPFADARRLGRLAFLVGAGASRDHPANRPLATELSSALISGLWSTSTIARKHWALQTMLRRSRNVRFERLVQVVADTTGSTGILQVVRGGRPNWVHRALGRALCRGCPVLTTNFDRLIERAYRNRDGLRILSASEDYRRIGRRTPSGILAKLHGSIEIEESICASLQQVGALGPAFMWDPPRGEYLARVRRRYPLVVLGYSGADDSDVVPRLRITESSKPLLWLLHQEGALQEAKSSDVRRLATAPGLPDVLRESKALVLRGPARALLSRRSAPASPASTPRRRARLPGASSPCPSCPQAARSLGHRAQGDRDRPGDPKS